jgi:hypothetical protein
MSEHASNLRSGFSKCRGCGNPGVGFWVKGLGPMHDECEKRRQEGLLPPLPSAIEVLAKAITTVAPGLTNHDHADGDTVPLPRDHSSESRVQFASGATMSELKPRYDLICPTGLRRLAERYALGAKKHGDTNWCLAGDKDDKAFMRARLNHLIRHVADYLEYGNEGDDNLAAIAWAAFALMHYEETCRHHKRELPR